MQIPLCLPFLNESHIVSVRGLVSISFPFSFQFCTRLAAVFAEEVGGFGVDQRVTDRGQGNSFYGAGEGNRTQQTSNPPFSGEIELSQSPLRKPYRGPILPMSQ